MEGERERGGMEGERGREEEWKESVCVRERQSKCSATSC